MNTLNADVFNIIAQNLSLLDILKFSLCCKHARYLASHATSLDVSNDVTKNTSKIQLPVLIHSDVCNYMIKYNFKLIKLMHISRRKLLKFKKVQEIEDVEKIILNHLSEKYDIANFIAFSKTCRRVHQYATTTPIGQDLTSIRKRPLKMFSNPKYINIAKRFIELHWSNYKVSAIRNDMYKYMQYNKPLRDYLGGKEWIFQFTHRREKYTVHSNSELYAFMHIQYHFDAVWYSKHRHIAENIIRRIFESIKSMKEDISEILALIFSWLYRRIYDPAFYKFVIAQIAVSDPKYTRRIDFYRNYVQEVPDMIKKQPIPTPVREKVQKRMLKKCYRFHIGPSSKFVNFGGFTATPHIIAWLQNKISIDKFTNSVNRQHTSIEFLNSSDIPPIGELTEKLHKLHAHSPNIFNQIIRIFDVEVLIYLFLNYDIQEEILKNFHNNTVRNYDGLPLKIKESRVNSRVKNNITKFYYNSVPKFFDDRVCKYLFEHKSLIGDQIILPRIIRVVTNKIKYMWAPNSEIIYVDKSQCNIMVRNGYPRCGLDIDPKFNVSEWCIGSIIDYENFWSKFV